MTNQQHPITPPPELFKQWDNLPESVALTAAYRAGADAELEACCEWCANYCPYFGDYPLPEDKLRTARRPKPPSLAEEALTKIDAILNDPRKSTLKDELEALELSRAAIERLQQLEQENQSND